MASHYIALHRIAGQRKQTLVGVAIPSIGCFAEAECVVHLLFAVALRIRSKVNNPPTMSSTPESQASTKTGGQAVLLHDGYKSKRRQASENAVHAATSRDVLLFLAAFRILNALSIRTFFQPDEFFQSLEPAWQMAFGRDSGAWITWVLSMARQLRVTY